jgi:hypothetical protein
MKSKLYTIILISSIALLASCKTAKKMYEKGNYDEAVELAAKKLQKKPNDAATMDILQDAYRFAVEDHEARIRNNASSTNDLQSEWIYSEYLDLQRLYDIIYRTPSVFDVVRPTDYSTYVTLYREKAGDARYDRGMQLMNDNSRNSFRLAYREFERALALKPGDLTIRQKMDEAYANAVLNVVILPAVQSGLQYSSYNYGYANFDNTLLRYLTNNNSNYFLRYFSPAEANSFGIRTDLIAETRFGNMDIGRYYDQRTVREVSKQVVVKERVIKPDSVVKEYATVKAKITTTRRTLKSEGLLQVTVRNFDNQWLWNDTYRSEYNWNTEFSTYTGDERALSEEDKKQLSRREEFPPENDVIVRYIIADLQGKAECGLGDYFRRY